MCSSTILTRGFQELLYFQRDLFGQERSSPLTTRCKVSLLYFYSDTLVCEHSSFYKCACNPKNLYIKVKFPIRNNRLFVPQPKNIHIKMLQNIKESYRQLSLSLTGTVIVPINLCNLSSSLNISNILSNKTRG